MSHPAPKRNCNYCGLFHTAFVPIWIENLAPLYERFARMKADGITDLEAFLEKHPEEIPPLASCVEVVEVNEAAVRLYGADSPEYFRGNLGSLMKTFDRRKFTQALVAIWNQDKDFALETTHYTLDKQPLEVIISANIPAFDSPDLIIPITVTDITALRKQQRALASALSEKSRLARELQNALDKIKTLEGIVPICSSCKKIRDDKGFWNQIEQYISERTDAQFTHGICPDCAEKLYPIGESWENPEGQN